jgi:uncharacterized membrane protein
MKVTYHFMNAFIPLPAYTVTHIFQHSLKVSFCGLVTRIFIIYCSLNYYIWLRLWYKLEGHGLTS